MTVGRVEERTIVDAMATAARGGSGRMVLISGGAGIGKTDLINDAIAGWLASGGLAAVGRGVPVIGDKVPYLPWSQGLARPHGDASSGAAPLLGSALGLLARTTERDRMLAAAAVWRLLIDASDRQPLCLVLDDAQWADASSLALVAAGLPEIAAAPVLIVVASRTVGLDSTAPLGEHYVEWQRSDSCRHIRLGKLDSGSMIELVQDAAPDLDAVGDVVRRAGGNPFFALSLLRASPGSEEALPNELMEFLEGQLAAAGTTVLEAVRVVALAGEPIDIRVLAAVLGKGELELERDVLKAERGGLLELSGDHVRVAHDLIADAARNSLGPATRRKLHRELASAFEDSGVYVPQGAARRAAHWREAGELEAAFHASLEAARDADAAAAYPEKWQHLRLAVEAYQTLTDAPTSAPALAELHAEAAEAAYRAGEPDAAVSSARTALAASGGAASDSAASALLVRLITYQRAAGDGQGAMATADEAYRSLRASAEPALRAEVAAAYASLRMAAGEYATAAMLAREALDDLPDPPESDREHTVAANALITSGVARALIGDLGPGLDDIADGESRAKAVGDVETQLRALNNRSFVLQVAGNYRVASADALEGLLLARERHLELGASALLLANLVECLDWLGRWDEALVHVEGGLAQRISSDIKAALLGTQAHIWACRGDLPRAAAALSTAQSESEGSLMAGLHAQLAAIGADLQLWSGNPAGALEAVLGGLADLEAADEESETLCLAVLGMLALHSAGHVSPSAARDEAATAIATQVARIAGREGHHSQAESAVSAWRATYIAAAQTASGRGSAEEWASAAALWSDLGCPLWHARCLVWGAEYEAPFSRARATGTLSTAFRIADGLGAQVLVRDATALARRAHLTISSSPAAKQSDTKIGLTSRELQVLARVVRGETNRKIARTLFISERTASVHVSNIIRKLACKNRGEAAAIAHRLNLVPTMEE